MLPVSPRRMLTSARATDGYLSITVPNLQNARPCGALHPEMINLASIDVTSGTTFGRRPGEERCRSGHRERCLQPGCESFWWPLKSWSSPEQPECLQPEVVPRSRGMSISWPRTSIRVHRPVTLELVKSTGTTACPWSTACVSASYGSPRSTAYR